VEERYSRTVREGEVYASLRHVAEGVLVVNVGKCWDENPDATSKEWIVSVDAMDLLTKIYREWRQHSGDRGQVPQELPEKTD
jgi:hypothetical protein